MDIRDRIKNGHLPAAIGEILWPDSLRVLVLAPHPDDFDVIAVTLGLFRDNGNPLNLLVARGGSGVDDDYRPGLDLEGKADLRQEEQLQSIRFFGLDEERLDFARMDNDAEGQMVDSEANFSVIRAALEEHRPEIVFLPHGNDSNSAHRAMYSLFREAAKELDCGPAALLVCDPKTIKMRTDLYTPFGQDQAAWKAKMLRFHDSQQQRNLRVRGNGFDERILAVNRDSARQLKLKEPYAETFELGEW